MPDLSNLKNTKRKLYSIFNFEYYLPMIMRSNYSSQLSRKNSFDPEIKHLNFFGCNSFDIDRYSKILFLLNLHYQQFD